MRYRHSSRMHFGYDPYNSLEAWREWTHTMEVLYLDLKQVPWEGAPAF